MSRSLLVVAAVYVGVAGVLGGRGGPTLCPFRLLTGRRCPLCGLTRSVGRAARGDLHGALAHHPAGPAVVVATVVGWATPRTARTPPSAGGQPTAGP